MSTGAEDGAAEGLAGVEGTPPPRPARGNTGAALGEGKLRSGAELGLRRHSRCALALAPRQLRDWFAHPLLSSPKDKGGNLRPDTEGGP